MPDISGAAMPTWRGICADWGPTAGQAAPGQKLADRRKNCKNIVIIHQSSAKPAGLFVIPTNVNIYFLAF
jgi:hypothetical protein